jgi:DNA topoisomerase III
MEILEKLYNKGYLSYPRTETNRYDKSINLKEIVDRFTDHETFGSFASRISTGEQWAGPKNGGKDDRAHPPIHPVKSARKQELDGLEW